MQSTRTQRKERSEVVLDAVVRPSPLPLARRARSARFYSIAGAFRPRTHRRLRTSLRVRDFSKRSSRFFGGENFACVLCLLFLCCCFYFVSDGQVGLIRCSLPDTKQSSVFNLEVEPTVRGCFVAQNATQMVSTHSTIRR